MLDSQDESLMGFVQQSHRDPQTPCSGHFSHSVELLRFDEGHGGFLEKLEPQQGVRY
jgi:hypothetical protein